MSGSLTRHLVLSSSTYRAGSGADKTLTIAGGKGSAAEALFNQMSNAKEDSDSAMGGRSSINRYGPQLACEMLLQHNVVQGYVCEVEVTSDAGFISTNHE